MENCRLHSSLSIAKFLLGLAVQKMAELIKPTEPTISAQFLLDVGLVLIHK